MGKINVVLNDGTVKAVDEELAKRLVGRGSGRAEESFEAGERERQAYNAENTSSVRAAAEGAADTLTLGGYGKAVEALGGEHRMQATAESHPTARAVGEVGAMVLPFAPGVLGRAGKIVSEASGLGLAAKAGEAVAGVAGKGVGRLVEGGILGVGGEVARTNVTGDPLTIEGAVEGAGIGGVLNYGIGLVADKLKLKGVKAEAARVEAETEAKQVADLQAKAAVFKDSPTYSEARAAVHSHQAETSKLSRQVEAETKTYEKFVSSDKKVKAAIAKVENTVSTLARPAETEAAARVPNYPGMRTAAPATEAAPAQSFGDAVYGAAQQAEKFGERKAFISSIYEKMDPAIRGASLDEFKQRLIAASKTGEVKLSRADLVSAMDPKMVGASESAADGASYHFVDFGSMKAPAVAEAAPAVAAEAAAPGSRGPALTPEQAKEYRARISRIYQKQAGGWGENANQWTRVPGKPGDAAGALEDLRALQDELKQSYPKRSAKLDDIPVRPRQPVAFEKVDLPKSLKEFGKKHPESIARLANNLDDTSKQWFGRVAEDLGLPPGTDVATLHGHVSDTLRLMDEVAAKAAVTEAKDAGSFVSTLRKMAKNAAVSMAGFKAYAAVGGGVIGAGVGSAARAGSRVAMDGVEHSLLNNSLMASKEGIRSKVRDVVAKYGVKAGAAVEKMAPIASVLSTSFPHGKADDEKDARKLVVNRTNDFIQARTVAPDALYSAVEGAMGHPGDVAWKVHQLGVSALDYLVGKAPKDPGMSVKMFTSDFTPSYQDTVKYAHTTEAALFPMNAIMRELRGDGHPAAVEALWDRWPATMQEFADELLYQVTTKQMDVTYAQASSYSRIFRVPLTGLQNPDISALVQGLHTPAPVSNGPGEAGFGNSPRPVGRPAAVNSQVAGSSVSGLISQQ